jgi:methylmalonyl-CoA/ethylmalonyl-CoA epimerase
MEKNVLGTDVICQVGVVVRDIERTIKAFADLFGMDVPEIKVTEKPEFTNAKFRGEATDARAKLAFFRMGPLSLEFIEPVGAPSTWQEFLDEQGDGIHHIAFEVRGSDQVVAALKEKGMPVLQQGDYTGGRYLYIDSAPAFGFILELLENFDNLPN